MTVRGTFIAALAFGLVLCETALAVAPNFTTILPRGGQRGTEVEAVLRGANLEDAVDLIFHEPGITLLEMSPGERGRQVNVRIAISEDAPLGPQGVRVRTSTGISNLQLFSVGHLPEIEETEPNNSRDEAQLLEGSVTVNGIITNEDVDYFAVDLEEGERIAVEIEGLRLGLRLFDPKLRFFNPAGHELLTEDDTFPFLQDAGFVYIAEETGRHYIAVNDASYGGANDYFYRLHVGDFPRPFSVTPLGGRPGEEVTVTWLGDPLLESQTVQLPEDAEGIIALTASAGTGHSPTGIPFRVIDLPGVSEVEPNNSRDEATPGTVPGAFDGVIGEPGDADFFSFEATAGQSLQFRVWARELGSPLDSVLHIFNPDGSVLASDDDGVGLDSLVRVSIPEDGTYTLRVIDHLGNGGPTYAYRVEATATAPRTHTTLLENRPGNLSVARGNFAFLLVNVSRSDFDAPMAVQLDELPEGLVHHNDPLPAGETRVPVIVEAAPDAPVSGGLTRVVARSEHEEISVAGDLDQEIRLVQGRNDTTFHGRQVDRLAVAVTEAAPFSLRIDAPAAPIVHNGFREITVTAERAEGFETAIALRFPWLPNGMGGGTATIPENETSATIRVEVRPEAAVREHRVFVAGQADGWEVCTPWTPLTVESPWITFDIPALETEQGKGLEFPVKVTHNSEFEGAFEVTLLNLPRGVTAEPLVVEPGLEELQFKLSVAEDAPEGKFGGITARTTLSRHDEPVVHHWGAGEITVFKPLPPELQQAAPPPPPPAEEGAEEEPVQERRTRFPTT